MANVTTKAEYAAYERRVAEFMAEEGINCLSTGAIKCDDCNVSLEAGECPQCHKDAGQMDTEPYISSRPCDCCRDNLQGNREHATGYNPTTKEILEFSICQDCVYYAAYGRLDDTTMLSIEQGE